MKGTSVMWNYIMEEQEVLGRMLCYKALFETASDVPELESVYIVAHGSSYNASVVMADFLSRFQLHTGSFRIPCSAGSGTLPGPPLPR